MYFGRKSHGTSLGGYAMKSKKLGVIGTVLFCAIGLASCQTPYHEDGERYVFVATPWRPTYLAVYCAYVGTAGESVIIDSDHWRHYFLLVGVIWGLMTVSRGYLGANASRARHAGTVALAPNGRAA